MLMIISQESYTQIFNRVNLHVEQKLSNDQVEFRKGKSIMAIPGQTLSADHWSALIKF